MKNLRQFIKKIDKTIFFSVIKIIRNSYLTIKLRIKQKKIINYLSKDQYFNNISFFNNNKNVLSKLCEIHGSDKGYIDYNLKTPFGWRSHSYSNYYYNLFDHCRNEIKLLFELGIGTNNPNLPSNMTSNGKPGASLKIWKDYFPNCEIYGADIEKDILFNEERIVTFHVDQLIKDSIDQMWVKIQKNNFDIIIDDGLHTAEASISFFLNSFNKLKQGGIYIIEDVHYLTINDIINELKFYSPEIVILNSLDIDKPKYKDGSILGMNNNLIVFRK